MSTEGKMEQALTGDAILGATDRASVKHEDIGHIEDVGNVGQTDDVQIKMKQHAVQTMPESIRNMGEEERAHEIRKIVRKVDFIIMPIVVLLYILNYIDRQGLAAAKLGTIQADLGINKVQYATAISILFCTYLPFQIPSNVLIARIPRPGMYICCAVMCWGAVSAGTAGCQSYGTLILVRLLLGVTESVFFVGSIYYLSAWYTKAELGKRISIFYMGQQLGNAFGGLIAAGVFRLNGAHGITGWRWLFIIEGCITIFIGFCSALIMPEFPYNARLLTPVQRDLAVWRLQGESGQTEGQDQTTTKEGFVLAVKDIKLWMIILMNALVQGMGSITNFFPTIVGALGYGTTETLLLTAPPYIFTCLYFYVMGWISDRYNTIYPLYIGCLGISIIAYIISLSTLSVGARYFAVMFMPGGSVGPQALLYKTISLHLPRPYNKRAAAVGLLNAVGGTSNIWGSYLWLNPPRFVDGFASLTAFAVVSIGVSTFYRWYVRNENKKLAGGAEEVEQAMKGGVTKEMAEMGWRYTCW